MALQTSIARSTLSYSVMSCARTLAQPAMTIAWNNFTRRDMQRPATSQSSRFLSTSFTPSLRSSSKHLESPPILSHQPLTTTRSYWTPWQPYIQPPSTSKTAPHPQSQPSHNRRNGIIVTSCILLTLGLAAFSASELHKLSSTNNEPKAQPYRTDPEHTRAIFSNKSFKAWEPTKGEYTVAYGSRVELEAAGHRCVMPQLAFWWYMPYLPQVWVVVW